MEPLVKDIMSKKFKVVREGDPISKAIKLMVESPGGVIPVIGKDNAYLGEIIEEDLVRLAANPSSLDHLEIYGHRLTKSLPSTTGLVDDLLIRHYFQLSPNDTVTDAISMMVKGSVKAIPVVMEIAGREKLLGLVSQRDILEKILLKKIKKKKSRK